MRSIGPRGLVWGLLLGCLTFFGLTAFGEAGQVLPALARFPPVSLAAVLGLALLNYGLRLVRWDLYLRRVGVRLPPSESSGVFLSGLAFSVSPGKAGELVKSYMLRQARDVPVRVSAPVVLMERVADLFGVLALALAGSLSLGYGWPALALAGAVLAAGLWGVASPWPLRLLRRWGPGRLEGLAAAQSHLRALTSPTLCATVLALSAAAWAAECLGFWLVLRVLGGPVPVLAACFVYAFGTLVGALSLLPGGLVTTEGAMVAALSLLRVERVVASTATLLIRLCTLWFAVFLGIGALWLWTRRHGGAALQPQTAREAAP